MIMLYVTKIKGEKLYHYLFIDYEHNIVVRVSGVKFYKNLSKRFIISLSNQMLDPDPVPLPLKRVRLLILLISHLYIKDNRYNKHDIIKKVLTYYTVCGTKRNVDETDIEIIQMKEYEKNRRT